MNYLGVSNAYGTNLFFCFSNGLIGVIRFYILTRPGYEKSGGGFSIAQFVINLFCRVDH